MSTEPRYTIGTRMLIGAEGLTDDFPTVRDGDTTVYTLVFPNEAERLCDLLNAGEQARALAAAVAGLGEFGVHRDAYANERVAVTYHEGTRRVRRGDTPAAAIVALWAAVQATGEGE